MSSEHKKPRHPTIQFLEGDRHMADTELATHVFYLPPHLYEQSDDTDNWLRVGFLDGDVFAVSLEKFGLIPGMYRFQTYNERDVLVYQLELVVRTGKNDPSASAEPVKHGC